jgi:hypothetical protein
MSCNNQLFFLPCRVPAPDVPALIESGLLAYVTLTFLSQKEVLQKLTNASLGLSWHSGRHAKFGPKKLADHDTKVAHQKAAYQANSGRPGRNATAFSTPAGLPGRVNR